MHVGRNMSENMVCGGARFMWRCQSYIMERLGKVERAGKQRGVKLAVTEKMRIWRQGDKEFKQNEACRLAALPSVTGVISWGSLSLCLLPLFIWEWASEGERGGEAAPLAPHTAWPRLLYLPVTAIKAYSKWQTRDRWMFIHFIMTINFSDYSHSHRISN